MAQRNANNVFQDFHTWVKDSCIDGFAIQGAPQHWFLPVSSLRYYFTKNKCANLKALLGALFRDERPGTAVTAKDIMRKDGYMLAFATLLSIEAGEYIQHVIGFASLTDSKMPLFSHPKDFPEAPRIPDLFERFQETQWIFCAAEMGAPKRHFEKEVILPFTSKTRLDSGAGTETFKVQIHRDYCTEDLQEALDSDDSDPTFVLKKYDHVFGVEQYDNEVKAFQYLRSKADEFDDVSALIRFYGTFSYGGSFYILLHYADGGTLQELLDSDENKPESPQDIMTFWGNIMKLLKALTLIHYVKEHEPGGAGVEKEEVQGWHQDVKPANILIVRKKNSPLHLGEMKLADLGLCHFRRLAQDKGNPQEEVGTETYGAPETYAKDWTTSPTPRKIEPQIDIWSLGCVISEVAVWLQGGVAALDKYRNERREETQGIENFKESEMFHDKTRALRCVTKKLELLKEGPKNQGRHDRTTPYVAKMVKHKMLVPFDDRVTASDLYENWETIQERAQDDLESDLNSLSRHASQKRESWFGDDSILQRGGRTCVEKIQQMRDRVQVSQYPKHAPGEKDAEPLSTQDSKSNQSTPKRFKSQRLQEPQSKHAPSHMSVKEAKDWIEDFESGNKTVEWLDQACCKELKKRDHVFLIDDSTSMRQHWDRVGNIVKILTSILFACEADDKIDLSMVIKDKASIRAKTPGQLEEFVRRHKPPEMKENARASNLGLRLKGVFEDYERRQHSNKFKKRFRKLRGDVGHQPVTFYVLTDGLYQAESNVTKPIRKIIESLQSEFEDNEKLLGLQFVSFGEDDEGIEKLERLDKLRLYDASIKRDIVDHEPANANVWKMLLGSINDTFDSDPRPTALSPTSSPESAQLGGSRGLSHRRRETNTSVVSSSYFDAPQGLGKGVYGRKSEDVD